MRKLYKELFIIAFAIFFSTEIFAQPTFYKTIADPQGGKKDCIYGLPTKDGGYIMTSYLLYPAFGPTENLLVIKTDKFGNQEWVKTFGGDSTDANKNESIDQTSDGGYILCGSTNSFGNGNLDVYVVKIDSIGNVVWSKTFGSAGIEGANSIKQTRDRGFIITGTRYVMGGSSDIYLIRLDSVGNVRWQYIYGGSGADDGVSVIETIDDGFVVAGNSSSFNSGFSSIYVFKTDDMGNMLWGYAYKSLSTVPNNVTTGDYPNCIKQTSDDGFIITGTTTNTYSGSHSRVLLLKLDNSGQQQWMREYGDGFNNYWSEGAQLDITHTGDFVVVGRTRSFGTNPLGSLYLIKTDAFGQLIWSKVYSGPIDANGLAFSVHETINHQLFLTGVANSGISIGFLVVDSLGNLDCTADIPATVTWPSVVVTGSGGTKFSFGQVTTPNTLITTPTLSSSTTCFNLNCNLSVIVNDDTITCPNDSSGILSANVSGGSEPMHYNWGVNANFQTSLFANHLPLGNYLIHITDFYGCTAASNAFVRASDSQTALTFLTVNPSCGNSTGMVEAKAMQGTSPYYYVWSTGADSSKISNLTSGNYSITVSDSLACSVTGSVTINNYPGPVISSITAMDETCEGLNNGSVMVVATSPGSMIYNWSNSNSTVGSSPQLTNLSPANYTVIVSDSLCSDTASITVHAATHLSATYQIVNPTCKLNNGNITFAITGAVLPLNIQWSQNSNVIDSSLVLTNLPPAIYQFSAVDANGCNIDTSFILVNHGGDSVFITADKIFLCPNDTANICANLGLTSYLWNNGKTTACIAATSAGSYYVSTFDSFSCPTTSNQIIVSKDTGSIPVFASKLIMCSGDTSLVCVPIGYSNYHWNTGDSSSCISVLLAGNYYLTVTDNLGCAITSPHLSILVYPLPPVSISVNGDTLTSYNALTYQWYFNDSAIANATSEIYLVNQSGLYNVQVSDSNGCIATSLPVEIIYNGIGNLAVGDFIRITSNPVRNTLNINFTKQVRENQFTLSAFDVTAKLILERKLSEVNSVDVSQWTSGLYMLYISDADKQCVIRKIVKL